MADLEDGSDPSTDRPDAAAATAADRPLLVDLHRRRAVEHLQRSGGPVPVSELARQVVAMTGEKPPDTVSLDEQKRMYTALVRTHLPALEGAGLVEYDPARDTAAVADESSVADVPADALPDTD